VPPPEAVLEVELCDLPPLDEELPIAELLLPPLFPLSAVASLCPVEALPPAGARAIVGARGIAGARAIVSARGIVITGC